MKARTLTAAQARSIYDRIGGLQDTQAWYEDVANGRMIQRAELGGAQAVVEFGCGTGRLAGRLLAEHLGPEASYLALDQSETMIELARDRLRLWPDRARVLQTDGGLALPVESGSADRFLSTYVLDLLSEPDIAALLAEAHRILRPGGLLCLTSAAPGERLHQRLVMGAVAGLHAIHPALIAGCRPIALRPFLSSARWEATCVERASTLGITSEVTIARRLP